MISPASCPSAAQIYEYRRYPDARMKYIDFFAKSIEEWIVQTGMRGRIYALIGQFQNNLLCV